MARFIAGSHLMTKNRRLGIILLAVYATLAAGSLILIIIRHSH
jgi:hypothetical protein